MKKILVLSIVTVSSLFTLTAHAHGVWAGMRADKLQIVYGEGDKDNFYNPEWLGKVSGYNSQNKPESVEVKNEHNRLFLTPQEDTQVITIISNNGYWSNTKHNGWINKAKDENPEATKGKFHTKMSVNYINQDTLFKKAKASKVIQKTKAYGLEVEIVPSVDPRFLHVGDDLKVQVLFKGNPMKHTDLMIDAIGLLGKTVKTDDQGYATVKVRNSGLNMLAVELSSPRKDKTKADADGYFSSLNFTLSPNN